MVQHIQRLHFNVFDLKAVLVDLFFSLCHFGTTEKGRPTHLPIVNVSKQSLIDTSGRHSATSAVVWSCIVFLLSNIHH